MLASSELRKGTLINYDGAPYRVLEYTHHKMGRGGAIVKVKIKNLITGNVLDKTFGNSDKLEPADLRTKTVQFLYKDAGAYNFMDTQSYEQFELQADVVGDAGQWIAEGNEAAAQLYSGKIIGIELPNKITLKVTQTENAVKGDTTTNIQKDAEVETGAHLQVPAFVKTGDVIRIDTRTGEYLERA